MSIVKANDLTNVTGGIPTVKSQQLIPTAWAYFNGTGTVAIRDSEGISSITDFAVGQYRANFSTSRPSVNYAAFVSGQGGVESQPDGWTTSYIKVDSRNVSNSNVDSGHLAVIIMGGQA
jgi:hypothetical protein